MSNNESESVKYLGPKAWEVIPTQKKRIISHRQI